MLPYVTLRECARVAKRQSARVRRQAAAEMRAMQRRRARVDMLRRCHAYAPALRCDDGAYASIYDVTPGGALRYVMLLRAVAAMARARYALR